MLFPEVHSDILVTKTYRPIIKSHPTLVMGFVADS